MLKAITRLFWKRCAPVPSMSPRQAAEAEWDQWLADHGDALDKVDRANVIAARRAGYRRTMRGRRVKP